MLSYYEILEIDPSANQEDIRKAYKNLVLKYHPDKIHLKKTTDTRTIYEINEAFRILSNPELRAHYDSQIKIESVLNFQFLALLFSRLLKKPTKSSKPKDISITMPVTLEDVFHHRVKKCVVNVIRNGEKHKQQLYISLANYQSAYVFKGLGDWCDNEKGDVVIKLEIETHEVFVVDNVLNKYDLWMEKTITLQEFLYGKSFEIKGIDGNPIHVFVPYFDMKNMTHQVVEKGLPYYESEDSDLKYGDLYISFKLDIQRPTEEVLQRKDVRDIFVNFF